MSTTRRRKGIAFETMGYFVLGLVGLFLLLDFLGVINISVNNIFCSVYSAIGETPTFCEKDVCTTERERIMTDDTIEFTRILAAHAITCYHDKAGCMQEDNIRLCYAILPEEEPLDKIFEEDFTELLEEEGGCGVLENSKIVNITGGIEDYSGNCGIKDTVDWRVDDLFIKDQPIILIEYNLVNDTVMVKA